MKTFRSALCYLLLAIAVAFGAGCATVPGKSPLLIGPLLDRIVPADFQGDGEFAERGQYLVIEVKAGGLRKTADGWTWDSLEYRRTVTVPIAPGVPYKQEGWVKLSPPLPQFRAPAVPLPIPL